MTDIEPTGNDYLDAIKAAARTVSVEWWQEYQETGEAPYRPRALMRAREAAHNAGVAVADIALATLEGLP